MILMYLALFVLLLLARIAVGVRVKYLERKYARLATAARQLVNRPVYRQGNNSKSDPFELARQQYELGRVTAQRDRVETRYATWQTRADRLGKFWSRARSFKGRFVPYLSGAIDVALTVLALGLLGLVEWSSVLESVRNLLTRVAG
jgi:hypothetical protein